jgi:glycerol uptake operon antiterminator
MWHDAKETDHDQHMGRRMRMVKQSFMRLAHAFPVAAAIKSAEDWDVALDAAAPLLFVLHGDALHLAPQVNLAHQRGKAVVVHLDLMDGIGKDRAGIHFLRQMNIDGIITSRSQLVASGKAEGLITIQRLLLTDDVALDTAVRTIARALPDMVEVLPGVVFPEIAPVLTRLLPGPFIAGGFIRTAEDVARVRAAGGMLSSSSTYELWRQAS